MSSPEEEYETEMASAIGPFVGRLDTSFARAGLLAAVDRTRESFLTRHSDYVARGEIALSSNGKGNISIVADVMKLREDWEARELERAGAELMRELERAGAELMRRAERREANLIRRHRRLMRKCFDRVPPSTRGVWSSLMIGQQYAILKDIDYLVRRGR